MSSDSQILIFGHDAQLLMTRCQILEKAGFRVQEAASLQEAMRLLHVSFPEVMVLCHTLSATECHEVKAAAGVGMPLRRVLILRTPFSTCGADADELVLNTGEGPQRFLAVVQRMTNGPPAGLVH